MNPFVAYFISGQSFFTGQLCLLLAVAASFAYARRPFYKYLTRALLLLGILLIVSSSSPVYGPFFRFSVMVFMVLFVLLQIGSPTLRFGTLFFQCLAFACSLYMANDEYRYWNLPSVPPLKQSRLFVLGDSISAGIGFKGEKTWTELLQESGKLKVVSLAVGGATVGASLDRAELISGEGALVLIELGGNDVLRSTPYGDFERDLEKLFKELSGRKRVLLMFELPTPPLRTAYCSIQRSLARKYGVILVPRRFFVGILSGAGNTFDGLHLSNQGHERLASLVWALLAPSLSAGEKESTTPLDGRL
ncbi:MAG: hypothetical protein A2X49_06680 [Lentisphaerae bacterium GWF2_52_8]|nr:MAG: hypothetical protein A2X49_06680 [Lentisphaerae bacterium GWF2_52_8]